MNEKIHKTPDDNKAEKTPESEGRKSDIIKATVHLVIPENKSPEPQGRFLKYGELVLKIFQTLGWKIIVAFALLYWHESITSIVKILPSKISESNKLGFGGFSLEIQKKAIASGNIELAKKLENLSASAIENLLSSNREYNSILSYTIDPQTNKKERYYLPSAERMITLLDLEKRGLIKFRKPLSEFNALLPQLPLSETDSYGDSDQTTYTPTRKLSDEEDEKLNNPYQLTEDGKEAKKVILEVVKQNFQASENK